MKTLSYSLAILLLAASLPAFAQTNINLPPLAKTGEGAMVLEEFIYGADEKPTPECHASTIVEVDDGLVAAWFGGTYERHPDVGIWVAMKLDGEWSKPVEVVNGFQNDSLRYPTWNPVLFQPKDGPLMLFYKAGPNPRDWWGMLTTSDNGGRTWSKPVKLGTDAKIGHLLGPVKNKPIQLADGSILCPSSTEINQGGDTKWMVHFEITKDLGKTWEVVGPINDGVEFDAIQPSVLTYQDGKMQVLCRSRQQVVTQSWSDDNGQTWSEMSAIHLPNPNSGTDAVTLSDGRQLLVYNHSIREGGFPNGRNIINVAISDDGQRWKPVMTLEKQKGEYSYPAVIQASDGLVHITYTYQRKLVKYVVVDPEKLK
jgi:predicted neuraminidase